MNAAWARGGWKAVDQVFGRLPDSTVQVLHPAKYEAGEKPVEVALDAEALAKAMAGWTGTPEDTLGEFQLSVWLRENGVKALPAGDAAEGWGGDRLAYLRGPQVAPMRGAAHGVGHAGGCGRVPRGGQLRRRACRALPRPSRDDALVRGVLVSAATPRSWTSCATPFAPRAPDDRRRARAGFCAA